MKYRISRNKIQQKNILKIQKICSFKNTTVTINRRMWQRCAYWLFYLAASAQLHQLVRWFFHHEGFNVSCDKMGTNSIPLMFRCSSSLNLSLSLSPSLVVTHALGMRAGPSFRWHQRAWNSCSSSSSSSIRASSHGILLWGLQPRQLLPAEEGSETGRGGP